MRSASARRGSSTSAVELSNVSVHGFWILLDQEELFLPFRDFPWFKKATVEQLASVTLPAPGHLHWPALDIDLAVDSIRSPKSFPLVSRASA